MYLYYAHNTDSIYSILLPLSRYSRQVFEDVKIDRDGASSSDKTRPVRQSVPNLGLACTISHTG